MSGGGGGGSREGTAGRAPAPAQAGCTLEPLSELEGPIPGPTSWASRGRRPAAKVERRWLRALRATEGVWVVFHV